MKLGTGGTGIQRYYQDGVLLFEEVDVTTAPAGSEVGDIQIYTYWNNAAPATQSAYVDDFVFSTKTPPNTDSDGRPIIGEWRP